MITDPALLFPYFHHRAKSYTLNTQSSTLIITSDARRVGIVFGGASQATFVYPDSSVSSTVGFVLPSQAVSGGSTGESCFNINYREYGVLTQIEWYAYPMMTPSTVNWIEVLWQPPN